MLDQLGIIKVTHELPLRLNHVNCFVAETDSGWAVIDVGLHRQPTIDLWKKTLHNKTVSKIIITHYHPDHFGYAGALQKKTGAEVWMTKTDHETAKLAWQDEFIYSFNTYYEWSGVPKSLSQQMIENTGKFKSLTSPQPTIDHYLTEGSRFQLGHFEYEVIFTPGHSQGLITLFNKEKSVLLSTDHILPRITPNISYWFVGDLNPLKSYLDSLEKIKNLDASYVIPSHGEPFYNANNRIDEIVAHHEERLEFILDQLSHKITAFEMCQKLFPKQLTVHEMSFAIGETLAHLEYLRSLGQCKRETLQNIWYYERT